MKHLLKCYLYFGALLLLCVAGVVNYVMTHNENGFARMKSLGLDVQKFYCNPEIQTYELCTNQLDGMIHAGTNQEGEGPCEKYKVKMDKCKSAIQENDKKILNKCWPLYYDIFKCSEAYRARNDSSLEYPCLHENKVIEECVKSIVGSGVKDD